MTPDMAALLATGLCATILDKRNLNTSCGGALMLRWLLALLLLTLGLYGAMTAEAQTANAGISGYITDPTRALIVGATVTLTESDTRIATEDNFQWRRIGIELRTAHFPHRECGKSPGYMAPNRRD